MKRTSLMSIIVGALLAACFCTTAQAGTLREPLQPQAGWFSFQAALKDSDWLAKRRETATDATAAPVASLVEREVNKVSPLRLGNTLAAASAAVSMALPWAPALAKVQAASCSLESPAIARLPTQQTAMN